MTPPVNAAPPRLDSLTPLRFVAAALVVGGHGSGRLGVALGDAWPYAMGGAVSFFFVMSGFVLAYNYAALERGPATNRYFLMRFARAWPLHLAGLLAVLVAMPQSAWVQPGIDPWIAAPMVLTLTQTWFTLIPGYAGAFNPPAWTLSVDVFCYLLFPFLLVRLRSAPALTFSLVLAATVACPIAANLLGPSNQGDPVTGWNWYMLDRTFPLARLAEFALGMLVAQGLPRLRAAMPGSSRAATTIEVAVVVATGVAMAYHHRILGTAPWLGPGVADWLGQVGLAPAFAVVVAVFALGRGALSALLSTRPAVHLGDLAYALYIFHMPVLTVIAWPAIADAVGRPLAAALLTATMLVLAHLAWRWIELPSRRAIVSAYDRYSSRRARVAARLPAPQR